MARQWIGKMFQQNQATEMDGNVGYVFRFDVFFYGYVSFRSQRHFLFLWQGVFNIVHRQKQMGMRAFFAIQYLAC
jgi:hypothetical protein